MSILLAIQTFDSETKLPLLLLVWHEGLRKGRQRGQFTRQEQCTLETTKFYNSMSKTVFVLRLHHWPTAFPLATKTHPSPPGARPPCMSRRIPSGPMDPRRPSCLPHTCLHLKSTRIRTQNSPLLLPIIHLNLPGISI